MSIATIVSGGQSGVDRAALEAAVAKGVEYRGWCPLGGWAEDTPIPPGVRAEYPLLTETPNPDPRQRTAWNVRDSDTVLALFDGRGTIVSAGTCLAIALAAEQGKPSLSVNIEDPTSLAQAIRWLSLRPPRLHLNIIGPRESEAPGIRCASRRFILDLLS